MMRIFTILLLFITCVSCVDQLEFSPDNPKAKYLSVDGFIHNLDSPQQVKLSYAAPFQNSVAGGIEEPITDAIVTVLDGNGNEYPMTHDRIGVYLAESSFHPEVGQFYKLRIEVNGNTYESSSSKLPRVPEVNNLYFEEETKEVLNGSIVKPIKGLQFYADLSYAENEDYYLLDWDGTHIFPDLRAASATISDSSCETFAGPDNCYVLDSEEGWIDVFDIANTTSTEDMRVPLSFTEIDVRFLVRYSYRLRFYATDKKGFEFYDLAHRQVTVSGSIFDPAPARIDGNIHNINNPDELVLGYFGVFSAAEKRIYINAADITDAPTVNEVILECETDGHPDLPPNWCCNCLFWPKSSGFKPDFWQ